MIDFQNAGLPALDDTVGYNTNVNKYSQPPFFVSATKHFSGFGPNCSLIANLTAGFGIERCLVYHHMHWLTFALLVIKRTLPLQRKHHALRRFGVVAQELGRAMFLGQIVPRSPRRPVRPSPTTRPRALAFCSAMASSKALDIDGAPLAAQRILRQVEREAVGVIKPERRLPRKRGALGQLGKLIVQKPQAAFQRGAEPLLLQLQRLGDERLRPAQFGVSLPPSVAPASAPAGTSSGPACPVDARAAWPAA